MTHTLLLADDSLTIQRVIELTFADEDITVVSVGDGDKAIASLDHTPPDIVLADIDMPGRSGYDVARHMKETPSLAHIPVLLLTGAFQPVDPLVVAAVGCDGVLTKPFEPQYVIRRVKELLEGPKSVEPSPKVEAPSVPEVPPVVETLRVVEPLEQADDVFETVNTPAIVDAEPELLAPAPPVLDDREVDTPVVEPPVLPQIEPRGLTHMEFRDDPVPPVSLTRSEADVENYFEELDHAFATLAGGEREPLPSFDSLIDEPAALPAPLVPPAPAPVLASVPVPESLPAPASLADAFAALLAAERISPGPMALPARPAAMPAPALSSDELVERVTYRVLERLSGDSVRAMVENIVSATAERVIREEIDRIKSNIK